MHNDLIFKIAPHHRAAIAVLLCTAMRPLVAQPSFVLYFVDDGLIAAREKTVFFGVPLCLSRACLGNITFLA
jgi:hypothetical protein